MIEQSGTSLVTFEVLAGTGLTYHQAAKIIPSFRDNRPTNVATIRQWAQKGVKLSDGSLLKLETCRIGGRWVTSEQALARFIDGQTPRSADTKMLT